MLMTGSQLYGSKPSGLKGLNQSLKIHTLEEVVRDATELKSGRGGGGGYRGGKGAR